MSIEQIIGTDKLIAKTLGTTKKICATDSKIFAKEISKYIDSKDQKRGKDKDKKKIAVVKYGQERDDSSVEWWPLIKQVGPHITVLLQCTASN